MMNEDDFLKSANELLQYLCDKFGLNYIEVRAVKFDGWNKFRPSKFCSDRNYIAINELFLKEYRKYTLHEFRHYWQRENYPKVFRWWLNDHKGLYEDFQLALDEHNQRLSYLYCPLEKDAMAFQLSGGENGCEEELINPVLKVSYWRKILREKTMRKADF